MDKAGREEQPTPADKDGATVYYTGARPSGAFWDPQALIEQAQRDEQTGIEAVCVIQNISEKWEIALQGSWNVQPSFFREFAQNPDRNTLWRVHDVWTPEPRSQQAWHIDGIFEHHYALRWPDVYRRSTGRTENLLRGNLRHQFVEDPYPPQSTTRLSYYRVNENLYLILLDAPDELEVMREEQGWITRTRDEPTLRVLYASNRGGLLLPQLCARPHYDLMDSLKLFLSHGWHLNYLFGPVSASGLPIAIQPHPLLYLLSSSVWQANLQYLDEGIKHLSFVEIRDPTSKTNNQLHDMRERLASLRAGIAETVTWTPEKLDYYFQDQSSTRFNIAGTLSPLYTLGKLLNEAKELEAFLYGDLPASNELVEPFIYVPLSFVTGIFGMNIKEVNGSPLDAWVCFVALAVVFVSTALGYAAFLLVRYLQRTLPPRRVRLFDLS